MCSQEGLQTHAPSEEFVSKDKQKIQNHLYILFILFNQKYFYFIKVIVFGQIFCLFHLFDYICGKFDQKMYNIFLF